MRVKAFGFLIVFAFAAVSFKFAVDSFFINPYEKLCDLVAGRIYLDDEQMNEWTTTCHARARLVKPFTPSEVVANDLRNLFATLHVSHLDLYNANDSRRIWYGENEENGIESEFVDGELVIFDVQPNSPAADLGLKRGDIIVSIQGAHPVPQLASSVGGEFVIRRLKREFSVVLDPRPIVLDESPRFFKAGDWSVLRIPSFRAEFFDHDRWRDFAAKLKSAKLILVDLRGNAGGNFVAGLRFLSPFMCAQQEIGYLLKPKSRRGVQAPFADDLRDAHQLDVIDRADVVQLRTFEDYGCLTARVEVLIDSGTASTAEMVAQALRDYMGAKVNGVSSSGQLLVGVWYDVPELGPGWKLSIPEAVFQTRRGLRLEGGGVRVDREYYYDLADLQAGKDSWIEKSIGDFGRNPQKRDSASVISK